MNKALVSSFFFAAAALATADTRIISMLRPGVLPADVAARDGVKVIDTAPNSPFVLFSAPGNAAISLVTNDSSNLYGSLVDTQESSAQDGSDPAPVPPTTPTSTPTPPTGSAGNTIGAVGSGLTTQWNTNFLNQVNWSADLANSDGRTVKLAIVDCGLSRKATDLWSKVDAAYDVFGGNADDTPMGVDTNRDGKVDGALGHGTMVASVVATVAPKVRLVIAKVGDSDGQATKWNLLKGLVFSANQGAEIANVSMGTAEAVAQFDALASWCASKGMLVVAAIGNAAGDCAWAPSNSSKALCVAGLAPDDSKASFSNWNVAADACAPAVGIVGEYYDGSLVAWSGTSFAAPFVSAALADCLRRTSPQSPFSLISLTTASGRNVGAVNAAYVGKLGTALDIQSLDRKFHGQ